MIRALIVALMLSATTGIACAAKVDANLVPDGLYTAIVEKVTDAGHATVKMDNGVEVDVRPAKHTVVFSAGMENMRVKIYIMQGEVIALSKV